MYRLLIALACALFAAPAAAEWHVAESRHFVVYADDEKEDVEKFVRLLERYASALSIATDLDVPVPSPSNRLTIFMVDNKNDIRRLNGSGSRFVTGFYVPRAAGSVAFVPHIDVAKGSYPIAFTVLLHEYAHHHMALATREPMPMWLREGMAEYLASSGFPADGSVQLGYIARHRWPELLKMEEASVRELLNYDLQDLTSRGSYEGHYGKAWLLYHYLVSSPERRVQLDAYRAGIAQGRPLAEAAEALLGEIGTVDRRLHSYMRNEIREPITIPADSVAVGGFEVRALDEATVASLPLTMQLRRGQQDDAAAALAEARALAERYPDSAFVLSVLAQAAYEAGDDAAVVAAADRALAIDPAAKDALLYKGYAQFRQAPDATDVDAAYAAAMATFGALNALENDHPVPLVQYYRSYVERGMEPPAQAKAALERAAELAPQDKFLWLTVGVMQAREGRFAEARQSLLPISLDPHDAKAAAMARDLLARIDAAAPPPAPTPDD